MKKSYFILFLLLIEVFTSLLSAGVVNHNISTKDLIISGTSKDDYIVTGSTTSHYIHVQFGYKGAITLRNCTIRYLSTNTSKASPIRIEGKDLLSNTDPSRTNVNLILDGNNVIYNYGSGRAGIQVDQGAQINISAIDPCDNNSGTLVITQATANGGAGIGSLNRQLNTHETTSIATLSDGTTGSTAGGNIVISSGTITTNGGHGAGIGGGFYSYYDGLIVIYGGIVNASAIFDAAGIGSGCPTGHGLVNEYAPNSAILVLPPAVISAQGAGESPTGGSGTTLFSELGLAGTKVKVYIGDPGQPAILVNTADYLPDANIYVDLSQAPDILRVVNAIIDPEKLNIHNTLIGKTDASGVYSTNGIIVNPITFFTDATSKNAGTWGRPYLPITQTLANGGNILLPQLQTKINISAYISDVLENSYTQTQARKLATAIKIVYNDPYPMNNITFDFAAGTSTPFSNLIFLSSDSSTVVSAPTSLRQGDKYYIIAPIKTGLPTKVYSDVLRISGTWKGSPTGYIRQVVSQIVADIQTIHICEGSSYYFNGEYLTEEGIYTDATNAVSVACAIETNTSNTIRLVVEKTKHTSQTAYLCDNTYEWHGETLTAPGTYTKTLKTQWNCDSIVTLYLKAAQKYNHSFNATICHGSTYKWAGSTYSTTGNYTKHFQSVAGCDSTVTLHLTVAQKYNHSFDATICKGNTYTWEGTTYSTSGNYTKHLQSVSGCDSTVTLHLTIAQNITHSFYDTICLGSTYKWEGTTYNVTGDYTKHLQSKAGCDSTVTLHLFVAPKYTNSFSATICQGETYTWEGSTYRVTGNYKKYLKSVAGCDSTVTLKLYVAPKYTHSFRDTICEGSSYTWEGTTYTTKGNYTKHLQSISGCDSTVTLRLHVAPKYSHAFYAKFCEGSSYIWKGTEYSVAGNYTKHFQSVAGCDSLVTMHLTKIEPTDSVEVVTICAGETHTWHGQTFSSSIITNETINNAAGCDSVCTLKLTVLPALTGDTSATFCNGTPFMWHGTPYATGGDYQYTYTSKVAPYCDSIVTLHLTQLEPSDSIEVVTICAGGTHTWHGQTFTSSTTITETIPNAAGCDSVCVLNLKVIPYPDNVDDATGCMVPPGTNVWSIRQKAISEVGNIDDCGTTFCGDIDGDGQIEILAPIITDDVKFSKIGIFNSQAKAKRIIDVPTCSAFINIAIAKVRVSDSDYRTLIFFLAYDRYLYAYDPNGSQFWKSDQQFTSHSGEAVAIVSLSLADFNHDGWTEIYIGPEIFDAATGKRLAKYNGNKGHSDRAWKASRQSYQSVVADVVGDDRLELILGNTACSVNINSRTNETLNSITAFNSVPAANMKMEDNSNIPSTDGHTLLADMDGDGKLDVVVMHIDKTNRVIYIYVWNPRTGSMICTKKITNAAEFGTPNVGDIDHDGNLELNFIIGTYSGETTDANDKIYSLKYNKSTHNLEVFWTLHHDDASGSTGLSLFDFNQDGTMEIVYRDCEHLRIINGSMVHHLTGLPVAAPYDLANIPCTSGTGVEYPVIADVDADGEAEIVVVGNGSKLVIYESDLAPWAPARSVWNQFAYNITNVNEDLTIPTYLYNNAQIFTDASSTTRQPFNNFLSQVTTINTQGVPFIAAADVNVSTSTTTTYENDSIKIDISFCNQGDLQVNAPYCITAYKNAYRGSVLFVDTIKAILPIGDCLSHQVGFPISNVCSDKDINSIVIAVNDDGHGIAQHGNQQAECDTTNNSTSVSLPTDFRSDTTKYTPVICATELPYTFTPTGTIFPVGTTSGRTIIPETNKYGCDSIITIDLTVNPTLTGDTTATFCNGTPFIWHETSYPTGGDYPYIYTSKVSGCDSIVTLHLTQLEPTDSVENVTLCAGGTHTWHGQTFTSSTTITETIPNAAGCDSVCTLNLTILPALTGDTSATFCSGKSFTWHGTQYGIAGHYPYTYTSKVAPYCDSIVTLYLTQLEPTDSVENVTLCYGESHVWHGQTFTTSTTITETIPNAAGCDSVCTLKLTVLPALTGDTSATFCNGTPFMWHDTPYATGGDYQYTYTSKVAPYCDSIVTLHLTQLEPTDSIEVVTICYGGSHTWHGHTYTTTTTTTETIDNAVGCDSVCTLKLTVLPALTGDTTATFCKDHSFIWHGTPYSTEGHYPYTYTSKVTGCDSIVTLHLTQLEPTDSVEIVTICYGETHTWHGDTYSTSTTKTVTIPNTVGCDSVCTLQLTILPKLTGDTSAIFCNGTPFIWHGMPYATGGDYPYTYTSKVAPYCDSLVTLHLTQLEPTDSIENVTICSGGSHTWHGQTFTTSTTKTITIDNAVGCDSVCTLNLTVLPALTGDTAASVCAGGSFTWWDNTLSASGTCTHTYQSPSTGCDSIVTLTLTVLPVLTGTTTATITEGATYTWNGQPYTAEGDYTQTLTTDAGCDSVVTLHLKVNPLIYEILTHTQCADDPFVEFELQADDGLIHQLQFAFSQKALDQHFRDTTVTITTSLIQIPNSARAGIYDVAISPLFDQQLLDTRNYQFTLLYPSSVLDQHWDDFIGVLTNPYNGGYDFVGFQWYKNGQPMEGENHSYTYQPLEMGSAYSAMLEEPDGTKLMTCEIIATPQTEISLYPTLLQPHQIIRLYSSEPVTIWIYDTLGRMIYTNAFEKGDNQFDAPQNQGMYIIKIQQTAKQEKISTKKLIVR